MSGDSSSKYTTNASPETAIQFSQLIEKLDLHDGRYSASESCIRQIQQFLSSRFHILSLVQIQSFCATTNDHTSLASLNENLTSLISVANTTPELEPSVRPLIAEIISTHNVKVFYRCLTNEHSTTANPALRLLSAIVCFNNGLFVDEFLDHFDLSLKSLADLLFPTKTTVRLSNQGKSHITVRHYMSLFWLDLCSNASPLTRNDLLTNNKKINLNWIKFINEFDNVALIKKVLTFIDAKILSEKSYRKMTKCKLLGDFTLSKLVELYKNEEVKEDVHKLLLKITTDEENGLLFHDYRTWFSNVPTNCLPSDAAFNNMGVQIVIDEHKFKINNKIIYNVLTCLHPWSDILQSNLVISVLKAAPELTAPYTTHLFHINGAHDPKLTSFYVGQTLLISRIVQLPIPSEFVSMLKKLIETSETETNGNTSYLSKELLLEVICPSSLNRSSLTKGLNSPQGLIKQMSAQLVTSVLQKYTRISKLLKINENSRFTYLCNELQEALITLKLPDPTVFVGITNECLKAENIKKTLLLNYMKAAEWYYKVLNINIPLQFEDFNKVVGIQLGANEENNDMQLKREKLTDIDLLLFNTYLSLTAQSSLSNQQNKWFNIAKNSKNSLFTILAKLPYDLQYHGEGMSDNVVVDNVLIAKVVEVLSNFLDDTLAFEDYKSPNTKILYTQSLAIVLSILKTFNELTSDIFESIAVICKLLDESISRSIKTPYKYFDIVTSEIEKLQSSENKYSRLSVFYVVVCEQSKFADAKYKLLIQQWIKNFSLYMFLVGEPVALMNLILKEYCGIELDFTSQSYETFIKEKTLLNNISTNFSIVSFTPMSKLKAKVNSLIPKSDVEIIAVVNRIRSIINSDSDLNSVEELLFDLASIYGNYLIQKFSVITDEEITTTNIQLLDKKFWGDFFINSDEISNEKENVLKISKKYFVMSLFRDVFKELLGNSGNSIYKNELRDSIDSLIQNCTLSNTALGIISGYVWVLSSESIIKFLIEPHANFGLQKSLINIALDRKIKLDCDSVIQFCDTNENKVMDADSVKNFTKLIQNVTFKEDQISHLIELAKTSDYNSLYYGILEVICLEEPAIAKRLSVSFRNDVSKISGNIRGFKFLQFLSIENVELRFELYEIAMQYIQSRIEVEDAQFDTSLNVYISSIRLYIQKDEECKEILEIQETVEKLVALNSVRNVSNLIFSPEMVSIIFTLYNRNNGFKVINTWLYRATLYITKVFAEKVDFTLNEEFAQFLTCLPNSLSTSIWKFVPKHMLNSQLEVIFSKKWIQNVDVVKYCLWVVQTGSKNVIECTKLVNILLNNADNVLMMRFFKNEECKYYTSLIFLYLFEMNIKMLSSSYESVLKIIKMYRGTTRASDLVLKKLLMIIEGETGKSWIQMVSNWDLIDGWYPEISSGLIEVPDFIIDTPGIANFLTINIYKAIIGKSIKYFDPSVRNVRMPELTKTIESQKQDLLKLQEFYNLKELDLNEIEGDVVYDIEFLLLLLVNNEDLFKIKQDSVEVNIRALIETNSLQFVICGLAHELQEVAEISKRIISSILLTIEEDIRAIEKRHAAQKGDRKDEPKEKMEEEAGNISLTFKERSAFKVYLGSLLYTLEQKRLDRASGEENVEDMSKLFIIMLSYLVPILSNPGHFLYEKAYRYIIGGSKYRDFEIPMYKAIMNTFVKDEHTRGGSNDDDADYYRQLQWLVHTLGRCVTSSEDLKMLRRNGAIEQLLNLTASPFVSVRMEESIVQVFDRVVRVENGADLLIRSFGVLGFIEGKRNVSDPARLGKLWERYSKLAVKSVVASRLQGKDKRGREWCSDDFENVVKRVCR